MSSRRGFMVISMIRIGGIRPLGILSSPVYYPCFVFVFVVEISVFISEIHFGL